MCGGWIKIHKKFLDWRWYSEPTTKIVFLHLLLTANYERKEWKNTYIERGQVVTGLHSLSEVLNLSVKQIRLALDKLEETGEIGRERTNKYTLITICKYDSYQSIDDDVGQTKDNQTANKGQAEGKQRATTKEIKNIRNKEIYIENDKSFSSSISKIDTLPKVETIDCNALANYWNECMMNTPISQVSKMTPKRVASINARMKEHGKEALKVAIDKVSQSTFLQGGSNTRFIASFDWAFCPNNFIKIIEGNYDNKPTNTNSTGDSQAGRMWNNIKDL